MLSHVISQSDTLQLHLMNKVLKLHVKAARCLNSPLLFKSEIRWKKRSTLYEAAVDMIGLLVIFAPCWAVAPDLGPWDSILLFWGPCAWWRWWASLHSCPRKQVLPSLVAYQRRCIRKSGNTALSIHWSPVRTASHFWLNPLLQTVSLTFCKTSDFVLFAAHLQVRLVYDLINLMWKLICACVADATYSVAGRGRLVQPAASLLCIH